MRMGFALTLDIDMGTHGESATRNPEWLACAACSPGYAFTQHRSRDIFKPEWVRRRPVHGRQGIFVPFFPRTVDAVFR